MDDAHSDGGVTESKAPDSPPEQGTPTLLPMRCVQLSEPLSVRIKRRKCAALGLTAS